MFNRMRPKLQPTFFLFLLALVLSVTPKLFCQETIRVAVPLFPLLAFPTFVAHEKGFFQKEGLRAEIVRINSTPTTFQTLISGGVHIAVGAPGGLVTLNLQGIDVVAIGSWDNVMPYILATREPISDLQQLRGKRLGVNRPGSTPWLIMRVMLEDAGLAKDIKMMPLAGGSQERLSALKSGAIDAAPVSWALEPTLRKMGLHPFKGSRPPFITGAICVKKSYLQSHRSTVKAFLKGLLEASQYVLTDKKGTFPILARILRSEDKEGLEYVYDYMRSYGSPGLYPPEASLKNLLRMSAYDDPRAAVLRPDMIIDLSLLEELGQRSPPPAGK
ncbi:MAG: ABC transporter substrate-binding protein [Deltaproteobacteria bacterium]|nr:ABC transporter substrate-binding protein [Deltaproteobacteria bacterium]